MPQPRVKTEVFNSLCFTDFSLRKWTIEELAEHKIQYVGYGVETCPDTKKAHHQGWLYASTDAKRSFKAWLCAARSRLCRLCAARLRLCPNSNPSHLQPLGDTITLSGVAFTMMLELNERYSDVTFRMFVVRSAKGDAPTSSTLWQGASGNKMLDTFNTERFTILFSKYVKLTAPNMGINPSGVQTVGSGFAEGTQQISRATRIVKFYIPLNWERIPDRVRTKCASGGAEVPAAGDKSPVGVPPWRRC
jgi:hypothetical protein